MRFAYCLLLTTLVLLHGAFPAYAQEQTPPRPSAGTPSSRTPSSGTPYFETTSSEKPSAGTSTPADTLDAAVLMDSLQSSLATI
ncbi:MAG: hypothetical protein AAFQ86_01990, partial [Bacteroidota bacterium]